MNVTAACVSFAGFQGCQPLLSRALVAGHGPCLGATVEKARRTPRYWKNWPIWPCTLLLNNEAPALEGYLLEKHFLRKHGSDAYYGQREGRES